MYVHRIGRTGRAGSNGQAISLVSADEFKQLSDIERLIKQTLTRKLIDDFEPTHDVPESQANHHLTKPKRNHVSHRTRQRVTRNTNTEKPKKHKILPLKKNTLILQTTPPNNKITLLYIELKNDPIDLQKFFDPPDS